MKISCFHNDAEFVSGRIRLLASAPSRPSIFPLALGEMTVVQDVAYSPEPACTLDIYVSCRRRASNRWM